MVERIVRADDITDEEGAEPVEWTWDGTNLVIDLVAATRKKFEDAIRPYLEASRPRKARTDAQRTTTGTKTKPGASTDDKKPKTDYSSLEHAGEVHRGRVTNAEKQTIRDNFDAINKRLEAAGERTLDLANPDHISRYGLDQVK